MFEKWISGNGPYWSVSHGWCQKPGVWGKWNVLGLAEFTTHGTAVVDDFGYLVPVAA